MIKYYEKLIKREIRKTRKFKRDSFIKIIGLKSNVYDFSMNLIKKISNKNNLKIKISERVYDNLSEIEIEDNSILIIPLEGVFVSYLLYNLEKEKKYYFIFKKDKLANISYRISEFLLSKYLNKNPFQIDKKYNDFVNFLYRMFEKNEKYALSLGKFLEYVEKYY